jgi:IS5 family transposase
MIRDPLYNIECLTAPTYTKYLTLTFHVVKNLFRHKKLRYRGLFKNTAQRHTLFALANLVIVKQTLLAQAPA